MEDNVLIGLYRILLKLYPSTFRKQLGEEMVTVFAESAAEARQQGGPALARLIVRELVHFPGSLLLAYGQSWQQLRPAIVNAPGWPLGLRRCPARDGQAGGRLRLTGRGSPHAGGSRGGRGG